MAHGFLQAGSVVLALAALFAVTIYIAVRFRQRALAQNLQLDARDIAMPLAAEGWDTGLLLYGILQDFSATETGFLVRDRHNGEVGSVIFHPVSRKPWITIKTGDAVFEADVLPELSQTVEFHSAADPAKALCRFTRQVGGTYRFDVNGLGVLESKPAGQFKVAPRYEYVFEGKSAGTGQHIGGVVNRGQALVLTEDVPLAVRLFVLAIQAQRF